MKRITIALAIAVASFAFVGTAAAKHSFDVTLTATTTLADGNGCCGDEAWFAGTTTLPKLGKVSFTGFVDHWCNNPVYGDPIDEIGCRKQITIVFTSTSGKKVLTLGGETTWCCLYDADGNPTGVVEPPYGWQATGALTGSGVYEGRVPYPFEVFTFRLTGTLA